MDFNSTTKEYLAKLHDCWLEAEKTGQMTAELSYRPVLDEYFDKVSALINPDIRRIFEPKAQFKAGRPDWRFYNDKTLGVYGYVESKGLDSEKEVPLSQHEEQIEKYISLNHKVIITDGLEFIFYIPSSSGPKRLCLIEKPAGGKTWKLNQDVQLIETEFKGFFKDASSRAVSEERLIKESAARAVALAKGVNELADLPKGAGLDAVENKTIEILHQLKKLVEKYHDSTLSDRGAFARFIAQVLIFSLLYAHRITADPSDTPKERYQKIKLFWTDVLNKEYTEHLKPFQALITDLTEELGSLGVLGTWYEDCCLFLAHVQLDLSQTKNPDYHKLYEQFLEAFDPQTRFDFGAFYTPRELAQYTVKLTEAITTYELPDVSLYDSANKLIDPCCGTGSFLEQLYLSSKNYGTSPKIIGFEILPGPYALSHYRLATIGDNYPENVQIVLTNTLSDQLEKETLSLGKNNLIGEEQALAKRLAQPQLTLIIGNPPSSDSFKQSTGSNFSVIESLLSDFRPPEANRSSRQNTQKQLQNEYVKFLRWSANRLMKSDTGILAFVLPSSFAENPSYLYARKWLIKHFSRFWIMDIDLDGRTGVRASSIFHTLQGRMLVIGIRRKSEEKKVATKFHYRSITSLTNAEKIAKLSDLSSDLLSSFEEFALDERSCKLRPTKKFNKDLYEKFWPLQSSSGDKKYIFERHCSGLKLAPSSILVHSEPGLLIRRSREIGDPTKQVTDILRFWFAGQDKPPAASKFTPEVRNALNNELEKRDVDTLTPYAYRPFMVLPAVISEPVLLALSHAGGGGTRYRPEVLSAFSDPKTYGIAIAPSTQDIGESLHRFASFCWNIPDNDLCKRGNAHIFCNQFPAYKKSRKGWDPAPINNFNTQLLNTLTLTNPDDLLFYTYGILCSDTFLDAFEGALFTVSDAEERPRIPVTADKNLFSEISTKGKTLANLEKSVISLKEIPLNKKYSDTLSLFKQPFKMDTFEINPQTEALSLLENGQPRLVITPVQKEILEFKISGYQVLQQWLKLRTHRYSRTELNKEQFAQLLYTLQGIEGQMLIIKELDLLVTKVLKSELV